MAAGDLNDLRDTWNNAGTAFRGIKLNATDTASAAGSLLMELLKDNVRKFEVGKDSSIRYGPDASNYWQHLVSATGDLALTGVGSTGGAFTVTPAAGKNFNVALSGAGNFGIGTGATVSARLHVISTTEQLRRGYDASNYWKDTISSSGGLTMAGVGAGGSFTVVPTAGQSIFFTLSGASEFKVSGDSAQFLVSTADTALAASNKGVNIRGIRSAGPGGYALVNFIGSGFSGNIASIGSITTAIGSSYANSSGVFVINTKDAADANPVERLRISGSRMTLSVNINRRTSTAADPTTTEYPNSGDYGIHKNTTSGNLFLAANDGGAIKKVALT